MVVVDVVVMVVVVVDRNEENHFQEILSKSQVRKSWPQKLFTQK
jgi:hypothetical protein